VWHEDNSLCRARHLRLWRRFRLTY